MSAEISNVMIRIPACYEDCYAKGLSATADSDRLPSSSGRWWKIFGDFFIGHILFKKFERFPVF